MLVPIKKFIGIPVLSLQTGSELARIDDIIIDPRHLKIVAFRVTGNHLDHIESVLHPEDIREISAIGAIIDSSEKLMDTTELVRLQEIIDFGFVLPGIHVEDDQRHKLGTVKDFALDPDSFIIQQLYIKPSIMRSISMSTLTIHRSQIISVNNKKIVVKSPTVKVEEPLADAVRTSLTNPFRAPAQPETKDL